METCTTVGVWRDLGRVTSAYLDSKTLADLLRPGGANKAGPNPEDKPSM
jgi:DNA-binding IscR family transcriptional regulator